jgi:hypothetical protein
MSVFALNSRWQWIPLTLVPYISTVFVSKHDTLTNAISNSVQNSLKVKKITADKEFLQV